MSSASRLLVSVVSLTVVGSFPRLQADEPTPDAQAVAARGPASSSAAREPHEGEQLALPDNWRSHPMAPALEFALSRYKYIRANVRDFTCLLSKRERINGRLKDYEYALTKVRSRSVTSGGTIEPYSVFMQYLAPARIRGRRVLFVSGRNDGKVIVRNGGRRFGYITVTIDPESDAAKRESRYAITELGLESVSRRLLEQAIADIRHDPTGANTEVEILPEVFVDDRSCTRIQIVHPEPAEAIGFHIARVYIDNELQVPIRVSGFDWPDEPGEDPPLLEEYNYTQLKLNVGLDAADFNTAQMERS